MQDTKTLPKVEKFEWEQEWSIVTNKYGKLLTYNLSRYNNGYANLTYQGYITKLLESGKYSLFIDCGAYIGLFSQVAAHNCNKVIAIEAHPFYYGLLLYNMKYYENVVCCYNWVGYLTDVARIKEGVQGLVGNNDENEYCIDVIMLDDQIKIGKDVTTLIKMDIEGNELHALWGARNLIKNPKVHWVIDVHTQYNVNLEEVKNMFKRRKIRMFGKKVLVVEGLEDEML